MLPGPIEEFKPAVDGGDPGTPDLFVYDDESKAEKASRSLDGETRVETRKIDGKQRSVIAERVIRSNEPGLQVDVWVDKPIAPSGGE